MSIMFKLFIIMLMTKTFNFTEPKKLANYASFLISHKFGRYKHFDTINKP